MLKEPTTNIIGYKAPMGLFKDKIKENTLYLKNDWERDTYYPKDFSKTSPYILPKEIVETWEAVYEETKPEYKIGDWVTIVNPDNTTKTWAKYTLVYKIEGFETWKNLPAITLVNATNLVTYDEVRLATPEEIASAQEETVSMGGFEVVVKPTGIYHKKDNITEFCKGLYDFNNSLPKELGGYGLKFSDISFTRTGCQHNVTKLDAWVSVYTKYLQKQKS